MPAPRTRKPQATLFRGDHRDGVATPDPRAPDNVVRHILFLEGYARATPYTSTSSSRETAARFAGSSGRVWSTSPEHAAVQSAEHISNAELMQNLRGRGRGRRFKGSPSEVAQARVYAETTSEHLLDWCSCGRVNAAGMRARVRGAFW